MENNYEESVVDDTELDDNTLFLKHVVRDDHDLLTIDGLLKEAFAVGSDE